MRSIYSFIIFISIVLSLCFTINYYVLWRLCGFFQIKKGLIFWTVVIICSMSLIVSSILQSFAGNILSRIVYTLSANWLGILWLLFSTLIVYEILRLFIKINPATAGSLIITVVAIAVIYSIINAQLVRVKRITVAGNANLKVVQLSDIHIGSVSANFLRKIIDKTNSLSPDLILITGDLVDNHNKQTRQAIGSLKRLDGPVFFVTGNHENYVGPDRVKKSLKEANVKVLDNQLINYGQIQIIGLDYNEEKRNIEHVIEEMNIDKSRFCVLMSHFPVKLQTLSEAGVNLALSGHTHAGQIFPFNYVVGLFFKNLCGFYQYDDASLYVTSGTGTWGPRMRFGSRSEIVLFEIKNDTVKTSE